MLPGIAIAAILSLFGAVWCFRMASDSKDWRIRWLNAFGIIDLNSTRDQRRKQEAHLRLISYVAFVLLLLVSASCIYWVVMEVQEEKPDRTQFEKDQDELRKEMDKIRTKKSFRKLN